MFNIKFCHMCGQSFILCHKFMSFCCPQLFVRACLVRKWHKILSSICPANGHHFSSNVNSMSLSMSMYGYWCTDMPLGDYLSAIWPCPDDVGVWSFWQLIWKREVWYRKSGMLLASISQRPAGRLSGETTHHFYDLRNMTALFLWPLFLPCYNCHW